MTEKKLEIDSYSLWPGTAGSIMKGSDIGTHVCWSGFVLRPELLCRSAHKLEKQPVGLLLLLLLEMVRKRFQFQSLKALTMSIIFHAALADMISFQESLHDHQILEIPEIISQKPSFAKLVS